MRQFDFPQLFPSIFSEISYRKEEKSNRCHLCEVLVCVYTYPQHL